MSGLRGEVGEKWKKAGSPRWDYATTKNVCLEVNSYFEKIGQNPTPRFREEIEKGNKAYIRQWVKGCHFKWLNPRKKRARKKTCKV